MLHFFPVLPCGFLEVALNVVGEPGVPAKILAVDNRPVTPVIDPLFERRETQHRERVTRLEQVEELVHSVNEIPARLVLRRLAEELVHVHLSDLRTAGHLHEHAVGHVGILHGQQSRPVRRQLALPVPLLQRGDYGHQHRTPDRNEIERYVDQKEEQRLEEDVAAGDVAELVSDDGKELLIIERLHEPAVQRQKGTIDAYGLRVPERSLGNVRFRSVRNVQHGHRFLEEPVHPGELLLRHPDRRRQEEQAE